MTECQGAKSTPAFQWVRGLFTVSIYGGERLSDSDWDRDFGLDNGMKRTREECEAISTAPGVCTINGAIFRRHLAVSVWTILRGMSGHGGASMPTSRIPWIHWGLSQLGTSVHDRA